MLVKITPMWVGKLKHVDQKENYQIYLMNWFGMLRREPNKLAEGLLQKIYWYYKIVYKVSVERSRRFKICVNKIANLFSFNRETTMFNRYKVKINKTRNSSSVWY